MHWPIVRTLVGKEALRLAANRGALVLAALLVAAAGLLAAFDRGGVDARVAPPPLESFWVDYWQPGPWVEHLRAHLPDGLRSRVRFRSVSDIPQDRGGTLQYGTREGAVQLRPLPGERGDSFKVWFWFSSGDP